MNDKIGAAAERVGSAAQLVRRAKPVLRGWFHLGMTPVVVVAGIILIAVAHNTDGRVGAAVFTGCAVLLFGTSATYHRGHWSARVERLLKRMDHSNIFLIIAGTYTPFALCLLPTGQAVQLLAIVWGGALLGVLFRVFWVGAPRWLYTPVYVALGWVAVFYMRALLHGGGPVVVTLIVVGGLFYTLGAVVYGFKRPDPFPRWFGFHEIFHAFTVLAFAAHYAAALLAVLTVHSSQLGA